MKTSNSVSPSARGGVKHKRSWLKKECCVQAYHWKVECREKHGQRYTSNRKANAPDLNPGKSLQSSAKSKTSDTRPNNAEFLVILSGLFLAAKARNSQKKTEVGLECLKQEADFWTLALWFNETEPNWSCLTREFCFFWWMKVQFST